MQHVERALSIPIIFGTQEPLKYFESLTFAFDVSAHFSLSWVEQVDFTL